MQNDPIISIKNIGKKYHITHQKGGYIALRDVFSSVLKNPFRFVINKTRDITGMNKIEEYWALKNINLEIKRGEIIGVIGKNGAGKSTLLKILSQITPPTTGEITLRGSVGSLLEVGTGFHPELTGRENIFLNGAILGMSKSDIIKKFDNIVEFAGISQFLDTPVKYYSSGMYVRLAFSVAAHMEPEILIVDEVLAVGDIEFQKKCIGKMQEVTKQEGRTILFVSHNLQAVEQLCTRCVLLKNGEIVKIGKTSEVIDYYTNKEQNLISINEYENNSHEEAQIRSIKIINAKGISSAQIPINEQFYIDISYDIRKKVEGALIGFRFFSDGQILLDSSDADERGKTHIYTPGVYNTRITIPPFLFNYGYIDLEVSIKRPGIEYIDKKEHIFIEIQNINNPRFGLYGGHVDGKIAIPLVYQTNKIS